LFESFAFLKDKNFWRGLAKDKKFWRTFISGFGYGALSILYFSYIASIPYGAPDFMPHRWYLGLTNLILFAFPLTTALGIFISLRFFKIGLFFKVLLGTLIGAISAFLITPLLLPFAIGLGIFIALRRVSMSLSLKIFICVGAGIFGSVALGIICGFIATIAAIYNIPSPLSLIFLVFLGIAGFSIGTSFLFSVSKESLTSSWVLIFGFIGAISLVFLVISFKLVVGEGGSLYFLFATGCEFGAAFVGVLVATGRLFPSKNLT
jgi:hypothetical protein